MALIVSLPPLCKHGMLRRAGRSRALLVAAAAQQPLSPSSLPELPAAPLCLQYVLSFLAIASCNQTRVSF